MTNDFVIINIWPFADSFDALAAHPDKSVRREFERITSNNLIDTDEATKRLRKLAARAARVKG